MFKRKFKMLKIAGVLTFALSTCYVSQVHAEVNNIALSVPSVGIPNSASDLINHEAYYGGSRAESMPSEINVEESEHKGDWADYINPMIIRYFDKTSSEGLSLSNLSLQKLSNPWFMLLLTSIAFTSVFFIVSKIALKHEKHL